MKNVQSGASRAQPSLFEQAGHWWAVLHAEDASAADQRAFADWVKRSPERIEAYLHVARLVGALRAEEVRWPDLSSEQLVRQALAAPPDAIQLPILLLSLKNVNIVLKKF